MQETDKNQSKVEFKAPKKSLKVEFYVGLFTIIGLVSMAYLAVNMGGMRLTDSGYYIVKAEFDNISGLEVGAAVEIAGVAIGEVSGVVLDGTVAVVSLRIHDSVKIREDDIASIRTKGIIGDRYLKIIPGGADEDLKPGDTLSDTESVVDLEEILGKFIHRMED
ncbi:MAG: outer membrane lipid asymmetry maintenance protein MlaD [bacterium]|nr:outer membrane lipid asymmetry maintenance protein MlaD [bacterium]